MEAYTSFARVYDMFMDNVPYEKWGRYIVEKLRANGIDSGYVVDLGCGTGKLTTLLADAGYDMIGIDNSFDMLDMALEREDDRILYLMQDMREFEPGEKVSAVVSACDSINYILEPEDLQGVYDNAWHSYAMITARNLGAQIHNIAQGGIAIFDNTGYYHAPNYIGMESVYNKLCYFPEGAKGVTPWDFENYTPDVVLFAVGQNDPHNEGHEDFDIADPDYRAKWKNAYKSIILDLRSKYPNATFVLLLTVLCHGEEWDKAVDEIANELNDEKITHFMFTRTGKATPGHPRLPEQYEMAEELTAYLSNMGDKIWS